MCTKTVFSGSTSSSSSSSGPDDDKSHPSLPSSRVGPLFVLLGKLSGITSSRFNFVFKILFKNKFPMTSHPISRQPWIDMSAKSFLHYCYKILQLRRGKCPTTLSLSLSLSLSLNSHQHFLNLHISKSECDMGHQVFRLLFGPCELFLF